MIYPPTSIIEYWIDPIVQRFVMRKNTRIFFTIKKWEYVLWRDSRDIVRKRGGGWPVDEDGAENCGIRWGQMDMGLYRNSPLTT